MNNNKHVITVIGPTACGKTKLSVELALIFDGEVVSADSMQIYKDMDIATASPSENEKKGVVHHMLNFLDVSQKYSVAQYVKKAGFIIDDILKRGKTPVLAGGTGLYIDSLINNISYLEEDDDPKIREKIAALYEEKGADFLLGYIKTFDEESYLRLKETKNPRRMIRCIEIYEKTGITQTEQLINSRLTPSPYEYVKIGLKSRNRQYMYDRINKRVDIMLENGLLEEAAAFFEKNSGPTSSMAIGYKELKPYFDGEKELSLCVENLKMQTRRYAKRQLTWFLKDTDTKWFDIDTVTFDEIVSQSEKYVKERIYG